MKVARKVAVVVATAMLSVGLLGISAPAHADSAGVLAPSLTSPTPLEAGAGSPPMHAGSEASPRARLTD